MVLNIGVLGLNFLCNSFVMGFESLIFFLSVGIIRRNMIFINRIMERSVVCMVFLNWFRW